MGPNHPEKPSGNSILPIMTSSLRPATAGAFHGTVPAARKKKTVPSADTSALNGSNGCRRGISGNMCDSVPAN